MRGDVVEMRPSWAEDGLRIEFFGDEIERLTRFDPLTGEKSETPESVIIFPAKQFVTPEAKIKAGHPGDSGGTGGADRLV